MSTYVLGPHANGASQPGPRSLACEQCGKTLGRVYSADDGSALPAALAIAFWPELRRQIKRHEKNCQGSGRRRSTKPTP